MKLYIQQKIFTWGAKFDIVDEDGMARYHVEGEVLTIPKTLHIYDSQNEEVASVVKKLMALSPAFYIMKDGIQTAKIQKVIRLITPEYYIEGKGWTVKGDVFSHDYKIVDRNSHIIGKIHKAWMSWGDSFEVEYMDPESEVDIIATVLAIDAVMDGGTTASTAS